MLRYRFNQVSVEHAGRGYYVLLAFLLVAGLTGFKAGWFQALFGSTTLLALTFSAVILADLGYWLLFRAAQVNHRLRVQYAALQELKAALSVPDVDPDEMRVRLQTGGVFSSATRDTAVATFVEGIVERSRVAGGDPLAVDVDGFLGDLLNKFELGVRPISLHAGMQLGYGFAGTLIGMILGYQREAGASAEAIRAFSVQVVGGIYIAVLTTLVGLFGWMVLRAVAVRFQGTVSRIVIDAGETARRALVPLLIERASGREPADR